jgi:hypothetical protein
VTKEKSFIALTPGRDQANNPEVEKHLGDIWDASKSVLKNEARDALPVFCPAAQIDGDRAAERPAEDEDFARVDVRTRPERNCSNSYISGVADEMGSHQVSISPTFYEQLLCQNPFTKKLQIQIVST